MANYQETAAEKAKRLRKEKIVRDRQADSLKRAAGRHKTARDRQKSDEEYRKLDKK